MLGAASFAFAGGGGTLRLDDSQHFAGTVAGFAAGDLLDLSDIAFGSGTAVAFQEASGNTSGMLTVSSGTQVANLTLLGQYTAAQFQLAPDGHGGTLVTDPPQPPPSDLVAALTARPSG